MTCTIRVWYLKNISFNSPNAKVFVFILMFEMKSSALLASTLVFLVISNQTYFVSFLNCFFTNNFEFGRITYYFFGWNLGTLYLG